MTIKKIEIKKNTGTYKMGDFIQIVRANGSVQGTYILAKGSQTTKRMGLINIETGNIWSAAVDVEDFNAVPKYIIDKMVNDEGFIWNFIPRVDIIVSK